MGEQVAADESDLSVRVLASGQADARCVLVDGNDVRDKADELPGQRTLSASNVPAPSGIPAERPPRSTGGSGCYGSTADLASSRTLILPRAGQAWAAKRAVKAEPL